MTDRRPVGRPRDPKWDLWMDGDIWTAKKGVDFQGSLQSFRTYLYMRAKDRNMTVTTKMYPDAVQFQFHTEE